LLAVEAQQTLLVAEMTDLPTPVDGLQQFSLALTGMAPGSLRAPTGWSDLSKCVGPLPWDKPCSSPWRLNQLGEWRSLPRPPAPEICPYSDVSTTAHTHYCLLSLLSNTLTLLTLQYHSRYLLLQSSLQKSQVLPSNCSVTPRWQVWEQ
jgi:hypothetical protein